MVRNPRRILLTRAESRYFKVRAGAPGPPFNRCELALAIEDRFVSGFTKPPFIRRFDLASLRFVRGHRHRRRFDPRVGESRARASVVRGCFVEIRKRGARGSLRRYKSHAPGFVQRAARGGFKTSAANARRGDIFRIERNQRLSPLRSAFRSFPGDGRRPARVSRGFRGTLDSYVSGTSLVKRTSTRAKSSSTRLAVSFTSW